VGENVEISWPGQSFKHFEGPEANIIALPFQGDAIMWPEGVQNEGVALVLHP